MSKEKFESNIESKNQIEKGETVEEKGICKGGIT